MTWWRRVLRRDRLETDLDKELHFHVARLVEDYQRDGLSLEEATRRARQEFGGIEQLKEDCRDARGTRWVHDIGQDLRFAVRLLGRDRGFTAVALLALALGIGVNSLFFTIVNAMCLRGPLRHPSGIVLVATRDAAGVEGGISFPDFLDLQSGTRTLDATAAYATSPMAVGDDAQAPERVIGAYVSANTFDIAGEAPVEGRGLQPSDDRAGAPSVVVLSGGLWKRRYGREPGIVGRTIRINGVPASIVGVMRNDFRFPNDAEVWLPLAAMPELVSQPRNLRSLSMIGRLASDATLSGARGELDDLARQLQKNHPQTNDGIRMTAVPINERFTARITDPAWLAFITAGTIVLIIACANVANLLLVRAVRRAGEIAMRTSLGASRLRIVRQLLTECLVLAVLGGSIGVLLSMAGMRVMSSAIPQGMLPSWMALRLDGRVLAALAAVCVGTVIVFGFVPALYTSKTSVTHVIRDQRNLRAPKAGAGRWTTAFITLQFALTFVLLSAFAGGLRSLLDDQAFTFDPTNVMTTWLTLPAQKYPHAADRTAFYDRVLQEAATLPDVESASLATALPFTGGPRRRIQVAGRPTVGLDAASTVGTVAIGVGYFETIGMRLLDGRNFTAEDGAPGREAVIVSERLAQMYFPDQPAVGQRIRLLAQNASAEEAPWMTIVGIAPNILRDRGRAAVPVAYRPFTDPPATAALLLRGRNGVPQTAALRDRVRHLDPDLPLYRMLSMERVIRDGGWNPRVSAGLINTITAIAMILAVVGLYGVTAHGVAARAREIGIRVALGAAPAQVRWLVLRRALYQLALGVPFGILFTLAWTRVFSAASSNSMTEPTVIASVALLIVGVGIAACLAPARRAVRLDPLATIRAE